MLAKMLLCREAAAAITSVGPLGAALFWTSLWAQSGAVLQEEQANRFEIHCAVEQWQSVLCLASAEIHLCHDAQSCRPHAQVSRPQN